MSPAQNHPWTWNFFSFSCPILHGLLKASFCPRRNLAVEPLFQASSMRRQAALPHLRWNPLFIPRETRAGCRAQPGNRCVGSRPPDARGSKLVSKEETKKGWPRKNIKTAIARNPGTLPSPRRPLWIWTADPSQLCSLPFMYPQGIPAPSVFDIGFLFHFFLLLL